MQKKEAVSKVFEAAFSFWGVESTVFRFYVDDGMRYD